MIKSFRLWVLCFCLTCSSLPAFSQADSILLADPTIFYHDGTYYLYGTFNGPGGFPVYTSADLQHWQKKGNALTKGDSYGTKGFWAPQVVEQNHKFYLAYTANEQIAIAEAESPLGPFRQKQTYHIAGDQRKIDPFIFVDDDGKKYLYHVRLTNGNRIFVARMKDDLSDMDTTTLQECINGAEYWENTQAVSWPVTEGPTVLKHNGLYYMLYSANDFRNIDYAVGYATSTSPMGPWQKYRGNPIISRRNTGVNGTGHGDLFKAKDGNLYYVFHVHNSGSAVSPRKTTIVKIAFVKDDSGGPDKIIINEKSFTYLDSE
ncbi:glycoside hydrolase family 43 protein [Foetidibacter luteolus]|uniref:glycoside hydrolase family 43 protein n=1 Tax=Foetidibacter luteolus TaxID=2608880 RepID=UPI00129A87F6|nr:glycoside hydrolase family 43 protein [Foetidibacter luteolus]